jgi:hypothetical protein
MTTSTPGADLVDVPVLTLERRHGRPEHRHTETCITENSLEPARYIMLASERDVDLAAPSPDESPHECPR